MDAPNGSGRGTGNRRAAARGFGKLVINVWIKNGAGEYLMLKRHPCRPFSLCWECITGPVSPGESSESGAVRLASETIGLNLDREKGALIASMFGHDAVIDAWLFVEETDISSLTLNNEEAVDARWMLPFEIRKLYRDGRLVPELSYHDRVFSYIRPGSVF